MKLFRLIAAILLLMPLSAHAQDEGGLRLPPPGTIIMNLSATETQKTAQDMIIASLRIETEGRTAREVQEAINLGMQSALALAKKEPSVKASTGTYSVYPYDPPEPKLQNSAIRPQRWRGSQTIEMQSLDTEALLKLAGEIQEKGFAMNNLGYALSPEKYESLQDDLLVKALAKLTAKAALAAKSLNKSGYDMLNIDLSPSGPVMPMYARTEMTMGMAMDKSMPAPVAEPGETDVSLTVSARVLLKP